MDVLQSGNPAIRQSGNPAIGFVALAALRCVATRSMRNRCRDASKFTRLSVGAIRAVEQ
jgi:hypothetical protein